MSKCSSGQDKQVYTNKIKYYLDESPKGNSCAPGTMGENLRKVKNPALIIRGF